MTHHDMPTARASSRHSRVATKAAHRFDQPRAILPARAPVAASSHLLRRLVNRSNRAPAVGGGPAHWQVASRNDHAKVGSMRSFGPALLCFQQCPAESTPAPMWFDDVRECSTGAVVGLDKTNRAAFPRQRSRRRKQRRTMRAENARSVFCCSLQYRTS
jgi:hypothetical protein